MLDEVAPRRRTSCCLTPAGLAEVVSDDDERQGGGQLPEEILDQLGRDRVESRGGLVQQEHLGADGQCPGQAQQLLLAPRQTERRIAQPVLDGVPQADLAQPLLGDHVQLLALGDPVGLDPGHHVVPDGHRERVGALEEHADPAAQREEILTAAAQMLSSSKVTSPSRSKPGTLSFIRLKVRRKVDFPQPVRTDQAGDRPPAEGDVDVERIRFRPKSRGTGPSSAPRPPDGLRSGSDGPPRSDPSPLVGSGGGWPAGRAGRTAPPGVIDEDGNGEMNVPRTKGTRNQNVGVSVFLL